MAPAMAAISAIGEAGLALSNWSGVLDQLAKLYEKLHPTPVPPVYCRKCKIDIAFREYAEHWEIHRKNILAKEEELDLDTSTTMEFMNKNCKRQIPISKYAEHTQMHEDAEAAHLRSINLESKVTRAQRTEDISKGYVFVKPASTRNKE